MTINEKIAKHLAAKKPIGFESFTFDSTVAKSLTPPVQAAPEDRAYIAIVSLEADPGETNPIVTAHFREDGPAPTAIEGMTLGHGWQYEIQGYDQIKNFKIIAVTSDRTHRLQVTYYKLGDQ